MKKNVNAYEKQIKTEYRVENVQTKENKARLGGIRGQQSVIIFVTVGACEIWQKMTHSGRSTIFIWDWWQVLS